MTSSAYVVFHEHALPSHIDTKLIGVFSSQEKAKGAWTEARLEAGFVDSGHFTFERMTLSTSNGGSVLWAVWRTYDSDWDDATLLCLSPALESAEELACSLDSPHSAVNHVVSEVVLDKRMWVGGFATVGSPNADEQETSPLRDFVRETGSEITVWTLLLETRNELSERVHTVKQEVFGLTCAYQVAWRHLRPVTYRNQWTRRTIAIPSKLSTDQKPPFPIWVLWHSYGEHNDRFLGVTMGTETDIGSATVQRSPAPHRVLRRMGETDPPEGVRVLAERHLVK